AESIEAGRVAPAMGEDLPSLWRAGLRYLLGVDGDHDALIAEFFCGFFHESAVLHGGGIDRDLVGTGSKQFADIIDAPYAAADGERHEAGLRSPPHHVENDAAVLMARGDVEEAQFVGAGGVIGHPGLHGVAGIAQIDEFDAL